MPATRTKITLTGKGVTGQDNPNGYVEIRCRGCMRKMGVGHGHPMHKLFCSTVCAADFPVFENTERDDVIEYLVRARGWTAARIAIALDVSRQRANQLLAERAVTPSML